MHSAIVGFARDASNSNASILSRAVRAVQTTFAIALPGSDHISATREESPGGLPRKS